MKRLFTDNTGPNEELDTDAVQIAIIQCRNTPGPDTNISPAMCVFGRPTRDFIPIIPGKYRPHETWRQTLKSREEALRTPTTRGRGLSPRAESDRTSSQQMGQDGQYR